MRQWYAIINRDYAMAVLKIVNCNYNEAWNRANNLYAKYKEKIGDYDVIGGYNTEGELFDFILEQAKADYRVAV